MRMFKYKISNAAKEKLFVIVSYYKKKYKCHGFVLNNFQSIEIVWKYIADKSLLKIWNNIQCKILRCNGIAFIRFSIQIMFSCDKNDRFTCLIWEITQTTCFTSYPLYSPRWISHSERGNFKVGLLYFTIETERKDWTTFSRLYSLSKHKINIHDNKCVQRRIQTEPSINKFCLESNVALKT